MLKWTNWRTGWEREEICNKDVKGVGSKWSKEKRLKIAWYLLRSKSWKEDVVIFKLGLYQVNKKSLRRTSLLHKIAQGLLIW